MLTFASGTAMQFIFKLILAAGLALSYLNLFQVPNRFLELNASAGFYYLCFHLACSALLCCGAQWHGSRFRRFALPLSLALTGYYVFVGAVSFEPRSENTESGYLRLLFIEQPYQAGSLLQRFDPDLLLLAGSSDCPHGYPHVESVVTRTGSLQACSREPVEREMPPLFEPEMPPALPLVIPGRGWEMTSFALLPLADDQSYLSNQVVLRRFATHYRHSEKPEIVLGNFRSTIFGAFYQRFADGALLREPRPYALIQWLPALTSDLHLFVRGVAVSEYLRGEEAGVRYLYARVAIVSP